MENVVPEGNYENFNKGYIAYTVGYVFRIFLPMGAGQRYIIKDSRRTD